MFGLFWQSMSNKHVNNLLFTSSQRISITRWPDYIVNGDKANCSGPIPTPLRWVKYSNSKLTQTMHICYKGKNPQGTITNEILVKF